MSGTKGHQPESDGDLPVAPDTEDARPGEDPAGVDDEGGPTDPTNPTG